ncbi:MAG: glycoside hydrolase family 88 protein, partial [Firmicutes bacterium]|nr:glycoside hydrolase family 88 protein [Bacillota bacterium]
FNPNGFIRAWNGEGQAGWAIVDSMMNLPILYWARRETHDPRFLLIAKKHADMSIRHFVRADGSCNHIVVFDPTTGEALDAPAGQGYAKGSSWSRGQSWALYGFTLSYMATGEEAYLQTARRVAAYFMRNVRPDGLTDCDFAQPGGKERIDNIAGAIAACGLLELARITGLEEYHNTAIRLLRGILEHTADFTEKSAGILQKCTASYHNDGAGRHVNILYGDYFFVEALAKLAGSDPMFWMHEEDWPGAGAR